MYICCIIEINREKYKNIKLITIEFTIEFKQLFILDI